MTDLFTPRPTIPADAQRVITHRTGAFREIVEGATTGREYVIVELIDGRLVREFTDGKREASRVNADFIADQLRRGVFVEVG